jgi:hypothetical protein
MSSAMHTPVPDIPGTVIEGGMKQALMGLVNELLGLDYNFSRHVLAFLVSAAVRTDYCMNSASAGSPDLNPSVSYHAA